MTRKEHLDWCKARALEYCDLGDWLQAMASMTSDMRKHPETEDHPALAVGLQMMFMGMINTPASARKFIEGFN